MFHPDGSMDQVHWTDYELWNNGDDGIDPDDVELKFKAGVSVM